ncbi:hypothetical protein D7Z26_14855 [Cohnella endophytica]|uniref:Uncharacterized protein n=1 Tax=Cohnella endophytica TaxID=2419778 RepID=A0A494XQX3_9BACL|nr:hypothetical protein [Cohnella endophytica]RKP53018.1 hypothetical protein D7Z26_14855 [Cohnella endophytica]
MKKAYSIIAWGLALELLDFRINNFDLLPDVLGYLLVAIGLSRLKEGRRYFGVARWAAVVLMFFSVLPLIGMESTISLTSGDKPGFQALALTSVTTAIDLLMLYGICRGIRSSAINRSKWELALSAKNGWTILFVFGAMTLFACPFQLNYSLQDGIGFALFLAAGNFVCGVWVIFLVRRAGRELPGARKGGGGSPEEGVGGELDIIV